MKTKPINSKKSFKEVESDNETTVSLDDVEIKGAKQEALMSLTADLIENVVDGIVLGVVFNTKKSLAMSTFIAVWAHEFP